MPTSSQSKILSTIDYQLQKQPNTPDGTPKALIHPKSARRPLKTTEEDEAFGTNFAYRRSSLRDEPLRIDLKSVQTRPNPTSRLSDDEETCLCQGENENENENEDEDGQRTGQLSEAARRLLVLGTIRPSRTFYKDLPESDVEYLMEYFRRMRNNQRSLTSDEINAELTRKYVEYKPKVFFDSSIVTKHQVKSIEKYVEQIRCDDAEIVKYENPLRFVVENKTTHSVVTTIPHEFNDCLLTLISHSDPLRKSELIEKFVSVELLRDIKDNSLDISYFPGGINYDVPREEIQDDGQMNLDTYKKIKQRLIHKKIRYFTGPPDKKPNALIIVLPIEYPSRLTHQKLFDILVERLKSLPMEENQNVENRIVSIEFIPLSCISSSFDVANQFLVDCDQKQTKEYLLDKPLIAIIHKHSITLESHSYDEFIQREYQNYLKAEKYRELIKNHDEAIKRSLATK